MDWAGMSYNWAGVCELGISSLSIKADQSAARVYSSHQSRSERSREEIKKSCGSRATAETHNHKGKERHEEGIASHDSKPFCREELWPALQKFLPSTFSVTSFFLLQNC